MTDAVLFPGLTPSRHRHVERFLRTFSGAGRRFEQCSQVLGYDLEERYATAEIDDWEPYQIAFLAINLAIVEWVRDERGIDPQVVCGQSFGAYAATVAAGSLSLPDMVRLLRGSAAVERDYFPSLEEPLACVFFSRVDGSEVGALMDRATQDGGWLELSVRHDRGVHAVSGTADAVARLRSLVRERRGIVYYTVDRGEHCPQMLPIRTRIADEVYSALTFNDPRRTFVSDVTGRVIRSGTELADDLLDGWTHPTIGTTLYDGLERLGIERIVVPGPSSAFRGHGGGRFETLGVSPAEISQALR